MSRSLSQRLFKNVRWLFRGKTYFYMGSIVSLASNDLTYVALTNSNDFLLGIVTTGLIGSIVAFIGACRHIKNLENKREDLLYMLNVDFTMSLSENDEAIALECLSKAYITYWENSNVYDGKITMCSMYPREIALAFISCAFVKEYVECYDLERRCISNAFAHYYYRSRELPEWYITADRKYWNAIYREYRRRLSLYHIGRDLSNFPLWAEELLKHAIMFYD